MNIKELQSALELLERMYDAGGATKQAEEIQGVVAALGEYPDMTVEDFVREIGPQILQPKARAKTIVFAVEAVEDYVHRLLETGTDRNQFDEVFSALKSDRSIKIGEATEIAIRYKNTPTGSNHRYSLKSKSEAFEFIFATYIERAQFESKMGILDRMTKWAVR